MFTATSDPQKTFVPPGHEEVPPYWISFPWITPWMR